MNNQNSFLFPTDLSKNTELSLTYLLEQASVSAKESLKQFASEPSFEDKMQLAFGENADVSQLQASWQAGYFTFPQIEIVSISNLNGANGAFSRDTNQIYLTQEFLLANLNNSDAVTNVFLEEYGHYVDSKINPVDSAGDEGAIFSALVRGKKFQDVELQELKKEEDSAVITIDGKNIAIEQNIQISQLTNNNVIDSFPLISGDNVVWRQDDGNDREIYFYDGSTTTQLTNNNVDDSFPSISGNNVVWRQYDGNDWEIYFYNGSTTTRLTNNDVDDYLPSISGNNVVWVQNEDFSDSEIYFYNGISTQLTNNEENDSFPSISGNNVIWRSQEGNGLYFYNGITTAQLAGNNVIWYRHDGYSSAIRFNDGSADIPDWIARNANNSSPSISGNNIVWHQYDGNDSEIYLYDGSTTTRLTNNNVDDSFASISGDNVVWVQNDGNDSEIYFYDGSTTTQLTNNDVRDSFPSISGDKVVWSGGEGDDREIYFYNGSTTTQLTDNDVADFYPSISGNNVVWVQKNDDIDNIMFSVVPEKFEFTNLVIEGTEGETKEIEVTRTSEDLSKEETVEIKIVAASEIQALVSNLYSDASFTKTLADGINLDKVIDQAAKDMTDKMADSVGEPKNTPNRLSTSKKLSAVLKKLITPAEIAEAAYTQARATSADIFPEELSVTFAPVQAKATTELQLFDDTDLEGDQYLFLELFQNGKDLESSEAIVAIKDNDQTGVINLDIDSGLRSILLEGFVGVIAGAARGFIAGGGVGSVPSALIGGFAGGLTGAAKATVVEILKDVFQKAIVESLVSYKNGDNDNSSNQTESITGTDDSENLDGGEIRDSIDAGGGNDTVNSGAGDDTISGGSGNDTISGGDGEDLIEGGIGTDSLSGGGGSDVFGGSLEELNMDRIIDFSSEDVLRLQNTNFTQESLTVTEGSAILDIDADLDGTIDSTITLEGDFAGAEFLVEPVSIEGITETYITINDTTPIYIPEVTISDVSLAEGNDGIRELTFNVSLSEASDETVTIDYTTLDDTAIAGKDYTTTSGTLEFAPGEVEKTITVEVLNDSDFEADEAFKINLSNPTNATISDGQGMGIITNEEVDRLAPDVDGLITGSLSKSDDSYMYENQNFYYDFFALPFDSSMNSGDTMNITLTSDDFDPMLMILNSKGDVIEFDNSSMGTTSSQLSYEVPASEAFFVSIESSDANATGDYQLEIEMI